MEMHAQPCAVADKSFCGRQCRDTLHAYIRVGLYLNIVFFRNTSRNELTKTTSTDSSFPHTYSMHVNVGRGVLGLRV